MKRAPVVFCLFSLVFADAVLSQQTPVPEIPYRSVPDFPKLPADLYLGEVVGVAVNSKGHIFVFSRGNTIGPSYAAAGPNFWSLLRTENSCARSATTCMPGPSRTRSRSTNRTTSG